MTMNRFPSMNKEILITNILKHLSSELSITMQAAQNAHQAATDDQSVAETQYDTLAIEAGYLAEGQARRAQELQFSIQSLKELIIVGSSSAVRIGSLVQLVQDQEKQHWFFIAPAAAGFRTKIAGNDITVVTPYAPMGKALLKKRIDDEITLNIGNNTLIDFIAKID
jgi:transcription elongation GreA/GreB family factor